MNRFAHNIFLFFSWKEPDEILKLAKVVVLKRKSSHPLDFVDKYVDAAAFVQARSIEISATNIRNRVHADLPIYYRVPEKVLDYINTNKLYKDS